MGSVTLYRDTPFFGPREVDYTGRWKIVYRDNKAILYLEVFTIESVPVYKSFFGMFKREVDRKVKADVQWAPDYLLKLRIDNDPVQCGGMYD